MYVLKKSAFHVLHKFCERRHFKKASQEGHKLCFKKPFTHSYNAPFEPGSVPDRFQMLR